MIRIKLNDIKIFGKHGWYPEEAILGNHFVVNVFVELAEVDIESDQLMDTLDYALLNDIIITEFAQASKLLEHVIYRIKGSIIQQAPDTLRKIGISIKKMNPMLPGEVGSSEIYIEDDFGKQCAKCNSDMGCFGDDCWCKDIVLTDETREHLSMKYNGCLCPNCLK